VRVLLDHNVPAPLRYFLVGHSVETAYEKGWAELSNGDLLRAAEESGFDVLITSDKGIRHQQNLTGRRLALAVLGTNDWTRIRNSTALIVDALTSITPGTLVEIKIPLG
jgi:hypothetical protein